MNSLTKLTHASNVPHFSRASVTNVTIYSKYSVLSILILNSAHFNYNNISARHFSRIYPLLALDPNLRSLSLVHNLRPLSLVLSVDNPNLAIVIRHQYHNLSSSSLYARNFGTAHPSGIVEADPFLSIIPAEYVRSKQKP